MLCWVMGLVVRGAREGMGMGDGRGWKGKERR